MKRFILIPAMILLPPLLLITTVLYVSFDEDHYRRLWEKHHVGETTGMTDEELAQAGRSTLRYLRGETSDPVIRGPVGGKVQPIYGERAVRHLMEVRNVYQAAFLWRNAGWAVFAALVALAFALVRAPFVWLGQVLIGASILSFLGAASLAVVFLTDFHRSWEIFHALFFETDLWRLPIDERMIHIFPADFFLDTILRIAILWAGQVTGILLIGWALVRKG